MNGNFKVGNQVKVVDPDYTYDTYDELVKNHSGEHFKKYSSGYSPNVNDKGVIISIFDHPNWNGHKTAIVTTKKHVYAISIEGIENLQPKKETAEIKPFDWQAFKSGKFAVHCDTEEKAKAFLKECDEQGIKWKNLGGKKATEYCPGATCYRCDKGDAGLWQSSKSYYENEVKIPVIKYAPSIPSVREVHRPAKVGEWIKVVKISQGHDPIANIGDIHKVVRTNSFDGDIFTESGNGFSIGEYVVLENYQPEAKEEPKKTPLSEYTKQELWEELDRRYNS